MRSRMWHFHAPNGTQIAVKIVRAYRWREIGTSFVCEHRDGPTDETFIVLAVRDLSTLMHRPAVGQDRVIEFREGGPTGGNWTFLDEPGGGKPMNKPKYLDHYLKLLSKHTLEVVQEGKVSAFYLRPAQGGRMMSTLVIFTPEGIALMGDLTPETNGSVSCGGYGIGWFSGELSHDYLASKFLTKKWVVEIAQDYLRDSVYMESKDAGQQQKYDRMASALDEHGQEWLHEKLQDAGWDCSDGIPGWGYEPLQVGWLSAIQQTFARLYKLRETAEGGAA